MVTLDFQGVTTRTALHDLLKQALSLPEYYGGNLDALYDCLSEFGPLTIRFANTDSLIPLGDYGESLLSTFRDAAVENPNLTLQF